MLRFSRLRTLGLPRCVAAQSPRCVAARSLATVVRSATSADPTFDVALEGCVSELQAGAPGSRPPDACIVMSAMHPRKPLELSSFPEQWSEKTAKIGGTAVMPFHNTDPAVVVTAVWCDDEGATVTTFRAEDDSLPELDGEHGVADLLMSNAEFLTIAHPHFTDVVTLQSRLNSLIPGTEGTLD
jgi:hypothetical protein